MIKYKLKSEKIEGIMSVHIASGVGRNCGSCFINVDPLYEQKWIAETFLEDPVCYTTVRGMYGYTGS